MKLFLLQGARTSGKSALADKLSNIIGEDATIIRSNSRSTIKERVNKMSLGNPDGVIILDTNKNSRKFRRSLYQFLKPMSVDVSVVMVYKPLSYLEKRAGSEQEKELIRNSYINLEVPRVNVDCDNVLVYGSETIFDKSSKVDNFELESVEDLLNVATDDIKKNLGSITTEEHDCPKYHLESIADHIKIAMNHPLSKSVPSMKTVALFHDLGKIETKELNEDGMATYKKHANISANYLLAWLADDFSPVDVQSMSMVEVVHQHMNVLDSGGLGSKNIRRNDLGRLRLTIELFNKIDKSSAIRGDLYE